jgi:ssDNA-binding Zn-finger/Zn-ribbon topoisomerase 1
MDTVLTSTYCFPGSDADCEELCEVCGRELLWSELGECDWKQKGYAGKFIKLYTCPECDHDIRECERLNNRDDYEYIYGDGSLMFADPGGRSALRAETDDNPRNLPCPDCGDENVLTPADRAHSYVCDRCADRNERGGY